MPTGLASQQEDIPLVGVMSEFHVALREEIEPSQRKASSDAIPLVNGRRAAQVGGRYLFTFEIESALNLPAPAPGDLHVPSRGPLEATVGWVEGMSIVISVPSDLGAYVASARFRSGLAPLKGILIERIEAMADKQLAQIRASQVALQHLEEFVGRLL